MVLNFDNCTNSDHALSISLQQKLENQVEQERIEVDHLQELLQSAKEKALVDKDALKKATR